MIKKLFERKEAEDSLFLRALWLAQAFTCFYMVALVDPDIAHLDFYGLKFPLLLSDFWIAVIGLFLSYHYRHQHVKWLEWLGLMPIAICCTWFIDNLRFQIMTGSNIDLLLPTVHLMTGLFVSHSFELRSRFDFNFSLVLSLFVVGFAATIGKGSGFGIGMFVFVVLAATLLLLDCEARTFGSVQARKIDADFNYFGPSFVDSEKTANLLFPTMSLLALSIALFLLAPRAESIADQISAKAYSVLRKNLPKSDAQSKSFTSRLRSPYLPDRVRSAMAEKLASSLQNDSASGKESKKADIKDKGVGKEAKNAAKSGSSRNAQQDKGAANAKVGKGKSYFRDAEKQKAASGNSEKQKSAEKQKQESRTNQAGVKDKSAGSADKQSESSASLSNKDSKKPASDKSSEAAKNKSAESEEPENTKTTADPAAKNEELPKLPDLDQIKDKNKASNKSSVSKEGGKQSQANQKEKAESKAKPKPKQDEQREMIYTMGDSMDSSVPASTQAVPLFQVTCNRTLCFRQGAFDYFDGRNWQVSPDLPKRDLDKVGSVYTLRDSFPLALPSEVPAIRINQKFKILNNMGRKIIFAGSPYEIGFSGSSNISIDTCGNLKGSWALVKGIEYLVFADEALYDIAAMRQEGIPPEAAENQLRRAYARFMQIPDNLSDEAVNLSRSISGPNDNWFLQAEKICNYLRKNYKYSTNPGQKAKVENTTDRFLLNTKVGDCKDFASAFVLLCRASGIPARMVVGFTPGDFDPASGTRIVKLNNSHAWGEIYTPTYGWVPFDATPQGTMPSRQDEEERYFTTLAQQIGSGLKGNQSGQAASTTLTIMRLPGGKGAITIRLDLWDLLRSLPVLACICIFAGPFFSLMRKAVSGISLPKPLHPASKSFLNLCKDLKGLDLQLTESNTAGEFLNKLKLCLEQNNKLYDEQSSEKITSLVQDYVDTYNLVYFGEQGNIAELENKRKQIKVFLGSVRQAKGGSGESSR